MVLLAPTGAQGSCKSRGAKKGGIEVGPFPVDQGEGRGGSQSVLNLAIGKPFDTWSSLFLPPLRKQLIKKGKMLHRIHLYTVMNDREYCT